MKRYLTVKEAAGYLGIGVSTLYQLISERKISYIRIGRSIRLDIEDMDKFMSEHKVQTKEHFSKVGANLLGLRFNVKEELNRMIDRYRRDVRKGK